MASSTVESPAGKTQVLSLDTEGCVFYLTQRVWYGVGLSVRIVERSPAGAETESV